MKRSVVDKVFVSLFIIIVPAVIVFFMIRYLNGLKYDYCTFQGVEITKTLLGVWSTLLGFMITAVSILLSIGGNEYIKAFRKTDHYHTVMYTQVITCLLLFIATVFSTIIVCLSIWNWVCLSFFSYLVFSTFIALAFSVFFLFFMVFKSR